MSHDTDPFDEPRGIEPPHLHVWRSVAVTGHRPSGLTSEQAAWGQVALHRTAWRLRSVYGTVEAISGMALGADTWWALAGLSAGMRLAAYIPFEDQPVKWPQADQELWRELRTRAHREVVVGGVTYRVQDLHARNDAMIADADLMVALWNPASEKGGTTSAVKKIRAAGKPMLLLDPVARKISRERW